MAEKHIVGYTVGYASLHSHGERFDRLENACDKFEEWFIHTGNTKYKSFNSRPIEERDGINLTQRGGISLILRLTDQRHTVEGSIKSCPFCGAEIVLKCTKSVNLVQKTKEIPDGWEEVVKWEEPDQDSRVKEELAKVAPPIKAELTQEGENRLDYRESPAEKARQEELSNRIAKMSRRSTARKTRKGKKR